MRTLVVLRACFRDWRCWLVLWLAGMLVLAGLLLWDARSWLLGSPEASFRYTRLNQ